MKASFEHYFLTAQRRRRTTLNCSFSSITTPFKFIRVRGPHWFDISQRTKNHNSKPKSTRFLVSFDRCIQNLVWESKRIFIFFLNDISLPIGIPHLHSQQQDLLAIIINGTRYQKTAKQCNNKFHIKQLNDIIRHTNYVKSLVRHIFWFIQFWITFLHDNIVHIGGKRK